MNSGIRDLIIFIILVCVGVYIWTHKAPKKEEIKKPVHHKIQQKQEPIKLHQRKYKLTYSTTVSVPSDGVNELILTIPIPVSTALQQSISDTKLSMSPTRYYMNDDSKYADFILKSPAKGQTQIDITSDVLLKRYDYQTAQKRALNSIPLENKMRYLKSENNIEVSSNIVSETAKNISGNSTIEILQSISDYMSKNLELLTYSSGKIGAEKTLMNKKVSVGDYANVFVALARAKRIPSRVVSGYKVAQDTESSNHYAWAEVYFNQYGWVVFDPYNQRNQSIAETTDFYSVFAKNSFTNYSINVNYKDNSHKPMCRANVSVKFTPVD